jgi:hypothetical protein
MPRAAKWQHLAAALRLLQEVGPILHHLGAWLQIERMVVGGADGVARRVGKLQLDVVVVVALFMQNRGCKSTEAVAGHAALVSHPLQAPSGWCHVGHGLLVVLFAGEDKLSVAGDRPQKLKHFYGLRDKGTMCGVFIFIRVAGIDQRRASISNSSQRAPINSLVRTKVSAISLMASRVSCLPS